MKNSMFSCKAVKATVAAALTLSTIRPTTASLFLRLGVIGVVSFFKRLLLAELRYQASPFEDRLRYLPNHNHRKNPVASPDIRGIFELWNHALTSSFCRTQLLRLSCSTSSLRERSRSAAPNISLVAITIHKSGAIMLGSMLDSPKKLIVEPWCSVVHHSTEKWIMGMLTRPTRTRMQATLAPLRLSSKAAYSPMMPR